MAELNSTTGVIAREERAAVDAIRAALAAEQIEIGSRPIDLRPLPFEGTWGSASTIARMVAGDIVQRQLDAEGVLEGLSKKESKKLVNDRVGAASQDLAEKLADHVRNTGRFATVEAVNGYINVSYDVDATTNRLIREVMEQHDTYGHAAPDSRTFKVMIEHSQLNTHKAAHVGHLRNICLGVALTNISTAGGFTTTPVTYIGDIGRHVIRCLWCYTAFHQGEEPPVGYSRGRWLGELYVESGARLRYRDEVLAFVNALIKDDASLQEGIDRVLKNLWNNDDPIDGEDIAYILGKVTSNGEIVVDELVDADVMVPFFIELGSHMRLAAQPAEDGTTDAAAAERLIDWQQLVATIDWWPRVPRWIEEEKATFQLWEQQDPAFVQLWETTRGWSMDELREIFDEFGATFDVWFTESEVEEDGREMVRELLQRGVAEISDGLPVVKIDEKLGLEQETYRTMPILRSDGSTLYSTKDLALARRKFDNYDIDQSIWVVDVRQSLYFEQITRILELYGFDQADANIHLGYEFVTLPGGIMSSRKGNAPMLEDVRNATIARALAVVREKNPGLASEEQEKVAREIAIGAIKYTMLARDGNKVIVFDPDEALSFEGHSAPYIQYAHARACRILERAGVSDADVLGVLAETSFAQPVPEELNLLQQISAFPEMVQRAATEHRPLHITNYVFELAKRFNDFYHEAPVLQEGVDPVVRQARLALVTATRITLKNGLTLLGIAAPEQM
ncbi:MAG: arginine--tRNA ligase [Thermomicrobiales bacterium]|nr:arginine--tRNA ligase [Thermomicrobiales bacterium]